jgi:hypothetical protein
MALRPANGETTMLLGTAHSFPSLSDIPFSPTTTTWAF